MFQRVFQILNMNFIMVILAAFVVSNNASAESLKTTLAFYDGALQVQVVSSKSFSAGSNKDNSITLQVNDANGTPYPAITKEWVSATVEMTNMDMGITPVDKIADVLDVNKNFQGKLTMNPSFSMRGPWKVNISITVSDADGNPMTETQSVNLEVNK